MILRCAGIQGIPGTSCGRLTSKVEAEQRVVRTGICGHCGGALEPEGARNERLQAAIAAKIRRLKRLADELGVKTEDVP